MLTNTQIRKHFQKEDDEKLIELIDIFGKNWKIIHSKLPKWSERQLRDRYINYLQPGINKSVWTAWEDTFLLRNVQQLGHKWSKLAEMFPNRSPVNIKNRYSYLTGDGAKKLRLIRDKKKNLTKKDSAEAYEALNLMINNNNDNGFDSLSAENVQTNSINELNEFIDFDIINTENSPNLYF